MRAARVAIGSLLAITFAVAVLVLVPIVTGPALPPGATRLHIFTESPGLHFGCAAALLNPVRITTDDDALVLESVAEGTPVAVVWPSGFAAWRLDGRAVLSGSHGNVIGREGDVLEHLGGGTGIDDRFHICGMGLVGVGE